jgi:hypothetical protein
MRNLDNLLYIFVAGALIVARDRLCHPMHVKCEYVNGIRKVSDKTNEAHDVDYLVVAKSVDIVHGDYEQVVTISQQVVDSVPLSLSTCFRALEKASGEARKL